MKILYLYCVACSSKIFTFIKFSLELSESIHYLKVEDERSLDMILSLVIT